MVVGAAEVGRDRAGLSVIAWPMTGWPWREQRVVLGLLVLGWALLFVPTWMDLARTVWQREEQSHGPIILVLSLWLLLRQAPQLAALPPRPAPLAAACFFGLGALMYVLGRSQAVATLEAGAQGPMLAALLLAFKGWPGLRRVWFVLLFGLFSVPLPTTLVAAVTTPLKSAVSGVAAEALHGLGYPVGRSGVILSVGPYQLLVADACAGLNSLFTLEALGLLYLQLVRHPQVGRNVALCLAIPLIAFVANVIRVMVLALVTFHFGDAAGQGFAHQMAGMLLFAAGLALVLALDAALGLLWRGGAGRFIAHLRHRLQLAARGLAARGSGDRHA